MVRRAGGGVSGFDGRHDKVQTTAGKVIGRMDIRGGRRKTGARGRGAKATCGTGSKASLKIGPTFSRT